MNSSWCTIFKSDDLTAWALFAWAVFSARTVLCCSFFICFASFALPWQSYWNPGSYCFACACVHKLNVGWKQIRFLFKVRTNLIRNVANFASRCRKCFSLYSFFLLFALLHDLNYYPIFLLSKQKPVKLIYWTWSFTNTGKQSTVACLLFCVYSLSR